MSGVSDRRSRHRRRNGVPGAGPASTVVAVATTSPVGDRSSYAGALRPGQASSSTRSHLPPGSPQSTYKPFSQSPVSLSSPFSRVSTRVTHWGAPSPTPPWCATPCAPTSPRSLRSLTRRRACCIVLLRLLPDRSGMASRLVSSLDTVIVLRCLFCHVWSGFGPTGVPLLDYDARLRIEHRDDGRFGGTVGAGVADMRETAWPGVTTGRARARPCRGEASPIPLVRPGARACVCPLIERLARGQRQPDDAGGHTGRLCEDDAVVAVRVERRRPGRRHGYRSTKETTTRRSCSLTSPKRSIASSQSVAWCSRRWPPRRVRCPVRSVPRLCAALSSMHGPVVLVLDDVHMPVQLSMPGRTVGTGRSRAGWVAAGAGWTG